mmetsp:Transcript_25360/g.21228  ORF Transcript_25360/g.21228 Transcript_25360/m.21228 type:complete len:158 (-) Transcript_25360:2441-2914(-)
MSNNENIEDNQQNEDNTVNVQVKGLNHDNSKESFDKNDNEMEQEELSIEQMEEQIYRMCVERGEQWSDPDFNASNAFGQQDETELTDEQRENQLNFDSLKIDWKYPDPMEGYQFAAGDNVGYSELVQGSLGDCWFIDAISIVASKPSMLDQLFVNTD